MLRLRQTGQEIEVIEPKEEMRQSLLSPTKPLFATIGGGHNEYKLQMRDFASQKILWTQSIPTYSFTESFSPDGRFLAVANNEWSPTRTASSIGVYDAQTGTLVATIPTGKYQIRKLAFSPDTEYIASGLADTTILKWKLSDFKESQ